MVSTATSRRTIRSSQPSPTVVSRSHSFRNRMYRALPPSTANEHSISQSQSVRYNLDLLLLFGLPHIQRLQALGRQAHEHRITAAELGGTPHGVLRVAEPHTARQIATTIEYLSLALYLWLNVLPGLGSSGVHRQMFVQA